MKTLLLATAAVALATGITLSPATAVQAQTVTNGSPQAATGAPHYEWQYHYVGRHARYVGHWVWVQ